MPDKKAKVNAKRVKVRELSRILRASERFLDSLTYENKNMVLFIRELRMILKPYGDMDGEKFLEMLKELFKNREIKKVSTKLDEIEIKSLSLDKLKDLVSDKSLSTKELLLIAEKRLGIPTGVLKKMRKELIRSKILNTIQNIEKLDAIKKKASE